MPRFRQHNVYMKRAIKKPRRERLLVQQALTKLGVRYWQQVEFWNPGHVGRKGNLDGGYQWLDFVIRLPHGLGALIFIPDWGQSRAHKYQKRELEAKKAFLSSKGFPVLELSRTQSQQEYEVRIEFWMKKEERNYEKQSIRNHEADRR